MSTKSSLGRLNIGDKISSSIDIAHELAPILAMSNIKAGFVRSCPCCHIVTSTSLALLPYCLPRLDPTGAPAVLPLNKDDLFVDLFERKITSLSSDMISLDQHLAEHQFLLFHSTQH